MARLKSHMRLDVDGQAPVDSTMSLPSGSASTGRPAATPSAGATPAPVLSSDPDEATPFSEPEDVTPFTAEVDPLSDHAELAAPNATAPAEATAAESGTSEADTPTTEPATPDHVPRQTLAGRVWVGLIAAAVLLVLLIIFIAENTRSVSINFLGAHGHISEGLALLIAIVIGIVITLAVGSARILQLTLELRRHRRKLRKLS